MSHQPFEDWILDPVALTVEERRALQQHLNGCASCQKLERRWQAVHHQLRVRPMAAPAPGFGARWQAGLAERKLREQRRQAWKIFGIFLAATVLVLFLLTGYLVATTSPAEWLSAVARLVISTRNLAELGVFALQSWLSSTPLALNVALWIYLTLSLCGLWLGWLVIFWRTNTAGVHNV
jgi:anti-sigma factor RsiW